MRIFRLLDIVALGAALALGPSLGRAAESGDMGALPGLGRPVRLESARVVEVSANREGRGYFGYQVALPDGRTYNVVSTSMPRMGETVTVTGTVGQSRANAVHRLVNEETRMSAAEVERAARLRSGVEAASGVALLLLGAGLLRTWRHRRSVV